MGHDGRNRALKATARVGRRGCATSACGPGCLSTASVCCACARVCVRVRVRVSVRVRECCEGVDCEHEFDLVPGSVLVLVLAVAAAAAFVVAAAVGIASAPAANAAMDATLWMARRIAERVDAADAANVANVAGAWRLLAPPASLQLWPDRGAGGRAMLNRDPWPLAARP